MNTRDLISRLRDLGVRLAVVDGELRISAPKGVVTPELRNELAEAKEQLIELLGAGSAGKSQTAAVIPHADRSKPLPLSFAQQRMWFLEEFKEGTSIYNIAWAMRLRGHLDAGALEGALNDLVARHESLRTTFDAIEGEPIQIIAPHLHLTLERETLPDATEAKLQYYISEWSKVPFNLRKGPLLRARLITLGSDDHVLMFNIHHIISDAWSLDVLQREFVACFTARSTGQENNLPELPLQFADYAVWQKDQINETERARQLNYWKRQLAGAPPVLELPVDRPRPAEQTFNGARRRHLMPMSLRQSLTKLAREHDGTLFMVLLAAFEVLLHRYTGQNDIVVGTPIAGRQRSELETLIGLFLNTLVMRADLAGNPSFEELLKQVQKTSFDAFANQDLPFEQLVDVLAPQRNTGYAPIFQVLFMLQNAPASGQPLEGLQISPVEFDYGTAKFDLTLATGETPDGLVAEIEYNTDLFNPTTIERMLRHYEALLEAIAANPQQRIGELPLLDAAEQAQLERWNDTDFDYDRELTMHALFEQQAAAQPEAIALWADGVSYSYAELNRRANRLAGELVQLGAGPGTLIGVCVERRAHMITGLLAILKSGAAYVPLDPDYPAERVRFMLEDSNAPIVLTQADLLERFPDGDHRRVCLDTFDWGTPGEVLANVQSGVKATDLGYVIYTSGSTGKPKGVSIEHRNAVALIKWTADAFERHEFDGVLASTSICFDLSVYEIFCTLGIGGRVVLVRNALALPDLPADAGVTLINTVPSAIAELVRMRGVPASVKTVNLAGEPLTTELADAIYALGTVEDVNDLYGPSEDTTYSTWIRRTVGAAPRIGKPIHNTQAYVLDQYGKRLPIGVPGELYLGGSGVTRDYLNRPELSAEKFLPDRFRKTTTGRLYRTGDRVRYHRDGNLEFLGRIDHQIKLRGFRIELGEIESNLRAQPSIDKTVVIVREDNPGDQRLVAYVTPAGGATIDTDALRQALRRNLPEHMIPAAFVVLDAIPLTPNGKTDRKALPAPEWTAEESYVAPRTPLEADLCDLWAATLGVAQVGIHDDFFALGGHSLLAMKLVSRIRDQLDYELPLYELFNNPSVALVAEYISQGASDATAAITPCDRNQPLPLSFAQERLWFLHMMEPTAATYNVPWAITLHGPLDKTALQRAVDELVARHESLRTQFIGTDNGPVQIISKSLSVQLTTCNMYGADSQTASDKLHELAHQPFDLEKGPPVRAAILELSPDKHILLVCMHHVICDVWSLEVLFNELSALYEAYRTKQPANLPRLTVQYADYAVWQREFLQGQELKRQFDYWRKSLDGAPPLLRLPLDKPRPAIETHVGRSEYLFIERHLKDGLNTLAQQSNVTLFVLLLSAFDVLLHRYTGENDIVIGTALSGRQRSELEGIIGFFLNTLAIRSDMSGNPSFLEVLRRNRQITLDAFRHRDLPFEKLVEELQPARSLSHAPVFQVLFVLTKQPDDLSHFGNLSVSGANPAHEGAKLDLQLTLTETPEGLETSLLYNIDLFEPPTIQRMLKHFNLLLKSIVAAPETAIDALQMLSAEERKQLLTDRNDTRTEYPRHLSIKDVFEAQAQRTPTRTAIVCGNRTLSYADLNRKANQLAHYLQSQSVRPDTMIGVCMDRRIETLIAIVGIIKAGGAYVPLDPAYPTDRLQFMLDDTKAPVVISTTDIDFDTGSVKRINLDRDSLASQPENNPVSSATGDNLAYVIYTSGSTGRPKGTLIENHSVLRLVLNTNYVSFNADQRIAMLAPISFDASTFEIWGGLLHGACCVVFPERIPTISALETFLKTNHIDLLWLTSTLFNTVIDTAPDILASVQNILTGGEALSVQHIQKATNLLPTTTLLNCYGPTESTTFTTTFRIPRPLPDNWRSIPIGKPISNTIVYVLNEALEPALPGAPGELYIGGDGLSRGYLNLDELTNSRFIQNPFDSEGRSRLYKTGDLVRYLPDGNIEFLGRRDNQIKLRGFRIELGEIDAQIRKYAPVTDVATLLHSSAEGDKRLVSYVVLASGKTDLESVDIRKSLTANLPAYMIPATFIPVDRIPLTANGKADRRALPNPDAYLAATRETHVRPETPAQIGIASIWEQLLSTSDIGLEDNFFDLGGHSLLTIKLIQEIEKATGQRLTIADIFENPTIRELARLMADSSWLPPQSSMESANENRWSRLWKYIKGSSNR